MPRVNTNEYKYRVNDLYACLLGQMKIKGVTQERLGEELGLTQQVISSKLRKQQLTTLELMEAADFLGVTAERLAHLIKGGEK